MNDIVNSLFHWTAGLFVLLSVIKLWREKKVRGVSWLHCAFFASLGYWNLFYFSSLGQWWSFCGGIGIVIASTVWLVQVLYYTHLERNRKHETRFLGNLRFPDGPPCF